MAEKKKSNIWNYFSLSDDKRITACNLCQDNLKYSGGTSSMRNHLKLRHKMSLSGTMENESEKLKRSIQPKLQWNRTLPVKTEIINRNLAMFCVIDLRPVNIVQGEGFKRFVASLEPRYNIPCRTTVTKYIRNMYEQTKVSVVKELESKPVAITSDIWTSVATEGYMSVTGHYLAKDWTLKNKLLATRVIEDRHTGHNIGQMLKGVFAEFNISCVPAVVTDNASNMSVACREINIPHVSCFAHTLQLAINDGLSHPSIKKAAASARKLVGHFSHSVISTEALRKRQANDGVRNPLNLIQDVQTRWNSTFSMMRRLLLLRVSVFGVLFDENITKPADRKSLEIPEGSWKIMENVVPILEPLADATEILAKEDVPTSGSVYYLVSKLFENDLAENENDSVLMAEFKLTVRRGLTKRLRLEENGSPCDEILDSPLILATAIDPRYKSLRFLSAEKRQLVFDNVKERLDSAPGNEVAQVAVVKVKLESSKQATGLEEPAIKKRIVNYLSGDIIDLTDNDISPTTEQEFKDFIAEPVKVTDPLSWWKVNEGKFPKISNLARQYLCIPGTSVPSERVFSAAGRTVTKDRASLDSENVDMILFLNKNVKIKENKLTPGNKVAICSSFENEQANSTPLSINESADSTDIKPRLTTFPTESLPSLPSLPSVDQD